MLHRKLVVEFCAEDDVPVLGHVDLAEQRAGLVEHRQEAGMAVAEGPHQLAQRHVGGDGGVLTLNHAVEPHQGEHRLVGMVGDELALAGKAHRIDAVGLEDADG